MYIYIYTLKCILCIKIYMTLFYFFQLVIEWPHLHHSPALSTPGLRLKETKDGTYQRPVVTIGQGDTLW